MSDTGASAPPVVDFQKFKIGVQSTINSYSDSFRLQNDGLLKDLCPQIAIDISNLKSEDPLLSPLLFELMATFRSIFDPTVTTSIYNKWPPGGDLGRDAQAILAFMSHVISISNDPVKAMNWLSSAMSSVVMDYTSKLNSQFRSICVCYVGDKKNKEKHWMYITNDDVFILARGKEELVRVEKPEFDVVNDFIEIKNSSEPLRLYPVDERQISLWKKLLEKREPAFPEFLTSIPLPLPKNFFDAFVECFTASDFAVIYTLSLLDLKWEDDGPRLSEAIIDDFEYHGKMDPLLCFLFCDGLANSKNAMYSCLLKLILRRSSGNYFDNVMWRIIENMQSILTDELNLDSMLLKLIEVIVTSGKFISREIRQIASILMVSGIRKDNQKPTVMASLVDLFLMFITPMLTNPVSFDASLQLTPSLKELLDKFAKQLSDLLKSISLPPPSNIPEFYIKQLRDFLLSIANYDGGAEHAKVTAEKYQESVLVVLRILCSTPGFSFAYSRALNETNTHSSLSLHFCSLLIDNFRRST